jgi:hypothetical protein
VDVPEAVMGGMDLIIAVSFALFVIPFVLWVAARIRVTVGVPYEDRRYGVVGHRGDLHYSSPDELACGVRLVTALAWRAQQC